MNPEDVRADQRPATGLTEANREASRLLVIAPSRGWAPLLLREVWAYRELLWFFVWRDVKIRYRQTALGVAWVVLQPVINILVFSVLFGLLLKVPSEGVAYPVFSFAALLPWSFFAGCVTRCTVSLVGSAHLVTKVYFPRVILPLSATLGGLVDFGVAFLVLLGLMAYYGIAPTPMLLLLPAMVLWVFLAALGFGLWLSALNVRYRDVSYLVPVLLQIWMYVTPVIYGSRLVPDRFRLLLSLNPMSGVVEGFRWALLGSSVSPFPARPGLSLVIVAIVLMTGMAFFQATERTFADVV